MSVFRLYYDFCITIPVALTHTDVRFALAGLTAGWKGPPTQEDRPGWANEFLGIRVEYKEDWIRGGNPHPDKWRGFLSFETVSRESALSPVQVAVQFAYYMASLHPSARFIGMSSEWVDFHLTHNALSINALRINTVQMLLGAYMLNAYHDCELHVVKLPPATDVPTFDD